jgi:hypothetical protein
MILRFLFYAFLIYMLYKLVFNFIIPIYRTTKQVKKGFREMNERMRQAEGFPPQSTPAQKPKPGETKPGEYIDFEEVKD